MCFCPNGTVLVAFFNVSGFVHHSQVADWGNIYAKLEAVYNNYGGICIIYSAIGKFRRPYLI